MSDIVIKGSKRSGTGKNSCHKVRVQGFVPGNLIGAGKATTIQIDGKWLSKAWLNGKTFTLDLDGKSEVVKIHELQIHPSTRKALHVDLMKA